MKSFSIVALKYLLLLFKNVVLVFSMQTEYILKPTNAIWKSII